jgi:hypothetical protein
MFIFHLVPPQFVDDNSFIQQRTVIEGATLQISCSAYARPKPSITWFSRAIDGKQSACKLDRVRLFSHIFHISDALIEED